MDDIEEFVRERGYKYLLNHAEAGKIEIKQKYTAFVSKTGQKFKVKNADILTYDYLHKNTDIQLETFFKPVRTGLMKWLFGE